MAKKKATKTFVLDTNVILHDSSCIYKFEEHNIVLPIQVIEELDSFKKGFETINFHAREFCRMLDDLSSDKIFNGGVSLGKNLGKLRISLSLPWHDTVKENLRVQTVDAEIINLAYCLNDGKKDGIVIIVSKDVNLRLKAKALGVMAQDFLHETVVNIDLLFEEVKIIDASKELIDNLYKDANPVPHIIKGAKENQNFILKNDKQSVLVRNKDGSLKAILKDKLYAFNLKAKNSEQAFAMDALLDPSITLVAIEAKAGTGKTIISLASGLQQLKDNRYTKVFFSRQTISMGDREIGFLKGGIDEKIGPFMNGMKDNLDVLSNLHKTNDEKIKKFQTAELLLVEPLPYIRGRSLNKVFFIIDEAQNLTPHEVKTIVTRAGEGTKIVLIGDTHQIDHPYLDQRSNGLSYLIQKFKNRSCFSHVHLIKNERSALAELAGELL
jgi:PhoH-like ATPase